ncbi:MAG: hypothetical protein VKL59_18880 [Nostocaceae cyanobacterium]|nr:hypothetical protein [Nostocaceae cyanobacterium]
MLEQWSQQLTVNPTGMTGSLEKALVDQTKVLETYIIHFIATNILPG